MIVALKERFHYINASTLLILFCIKANEWQAPLPHSPHFRLQFVDDC